jgi:hypothetical protein
VPLLVARLLPDRYVVLTLYCVMRYYSNVGKNPVSFRLSDEAVRMLAMLSDKLGLSQASVIEFVLRWFVKKEKMEEK